MPECTPEERALLDALNGGPDKNIYELRAELIMSRVPPELFEAAVAARCMQIRAGQMNEKAWDALHEIGVANKHNAGSKAFDAFYERIDKAAAERAGK